MVEESRSCWVFLLQQQELLMFLRKRIIIYKLVVEFLCQPIKTCLTCNVARFVGLESKSLAATSTYNPGPNFETNLCLCILPFFLPLLDQSVALINPCCLLAALYPAVQHPPGLAPFSKIILSFSDSCLLLSHT